MLRLRFTLAGTESPRRPRGPGAHVYARREARMGCEVYIVVLNVGQQADPLCQALRVQELARKLAKQLGLGVLEVRVERPRERLQRRERREAAGGVQCGKPVPRQTAPRR